MVGEAHWGRRDSFQLALLLHHVPSGDYEEGDETSDETFQLALLLHHVPRI